MKQDKQLGGVREVFLAFLKLGMTSFGGPAAHLGYFRKELVERRGWVSESQFSQLLAISQFLPGPASSQLGFSLGLIRGGWPGAIAAFLAFTLPSALLMFGFAAMLPLFTGPYAQAVLHGLKVAAFAVVADAVLGMARKLCPDWQRLLLSVVVVIVLLLVDAAWAQLAVIAAGGLAGALLCRVEVSAAEIPLPLHYGKSLSVTFILLFLLLLAGLPLLSSLTNQSLVVMADDFYRAGALVFGGGHVVLPLLADPVVATGLISEESFLAGYGTAQLIPGPMFSFSAYLGAVMDTAYPSWLGATVALLSIFLPGFLLVSAILPLWSSIPASQPLHGAIAGVNAAVVGILAAALYDPIFTSAINDAADLLIGLLAFAMLAGTRLSPLWAVAGCVAGSVVVRLF